MMDRRRHIYHCQPGFTLLEILVTIIVGAIMATLLLQVMGGHSWRSFQPLQAFNHSMTLQETMSIISSHYRDLLIRDDTPLVTLQTDIESGDQWSGQPYADEMQTETYCIDFNQTAPRSWSDTMTSDTCSSSDTILRVTLTYHDQSLTALFTR
jgi:prepilin-type N-terminal cleavage/methylation domain-containing protein